VKFTGIVPTTQLPQDTFCPRCHQLVHLYDRSIYDVPARMLIQMYRKDPFGYMDVPKIYNSIVGQQRGGGDNVKPHLWGLIEKQPGVRDDGSSRTGMWRLTREGRLFVLGRLFIPKYAMVYNGECHYLTGPLWHIYQALGKNFNYRELMGYDD
jgi:hypothetical protein